MPHTISTIRSLSRSLDEEFGVEPGESADEALRRIDRRASDLVRSHLLGDAAARSTHPAGRTA